LEYNLVQLKAIVRWVAPEFLCLLPATTPSWVVAAPS